MTANVGMIDRGLRFFLDVTLLLLWFFQPASLLENEFVFTLGLVIGIVMIATSPVSSCLLYRFICKGCRT